MDSPDPREVRAHLERVTRSPMFADSDRMRRFLRFTVESKLAGQHDRVKEYVLGREVFDRTDGYDPRLDPIVRVEARRLRSKLDEYYRGPGLAERIRVEYPKGGYLPIFTSGKPEKARLLRHAMVLLAGCAAALLVAIAGAMAYRAATRARPSDMLAVVPARWIERNYGDLDPADVELSQAVTGELANRHVTRVLAWPILSQYEGRVTTIRNLAAAVGVSKVLLISIRDEANQKFVAVFLIDPKSGEKLRMQRYFAPAIATLSEQDALAREIASDLATASPPR